MRWQLLDISPSVQESALELWVVLCSEKKYQPASYVDFLSEYPKYVSLSSSFKGGEKAETKGRL